MKSAIIVFPGSNCDRDLAVAFKAAFGSAPKMVWHKDAVLPSGVDIVGIPGGFSFGDYLRCGAIAARSPICQAVADFANGGGYVVGICNGFQVLTETGLLPGALMRNKHLKYICKDIELTVENNSTSFTHGYQVGQTIRIPIAHHDGNYFADSDTVSRLNDEARVAFRYRDNPNGSVDDIAGVLSPNKRVLGMMPHPERLNDAMLGGTDGSVMFGSIEAALG
jgi:phosphoribosylformylglycinamidine synthase I